MPEVMLLEQWQGMWVIHSLHHNAAEALNAAIDAGLEYFRIEKW